MRRVALAAVIILAAVFISGGTLRADEQGTAARKLSDYKGVAGARLLCSSRASLWMRRGIIAGLAVTGDSASVDALITVAEERTYLNRFAAEALGFVKSKEDQGRIRTFLENNLSNDDALYAAACIRSYARVLARDSIAQLIRALDENREREDGYAEMVCSAAVIELAGLGCADAVPALVQQLERPGIDGWTLDYGSLVVRSLVQLGDAGAIPGLKGYAHRLQVVRPDDPLAGARFDVMIAEVKQAVRDLDGRAE